MFVSKHWCAYYLSLALNQDFVIISGSWKTASQLVSIVIECCTGLTSNTLTLTQDLLPNLVPVTIHIMVKIANEYNKAEKVRLMLLDWFYGTVQHIFISMHCPSVHSVKGRFFQCASFAV